MVLNLRSGTMNNLPFVSVIIPTYNRAHFLQNTLESFINQKKYPQDRYEIIVSDNKCEDNTQELVKKYSSEFKNIRGIFEKRRGSHYARNSAAKVARGDILYFTDDDMLADENLLSEIVKIFDLDPMIGTATGLIVGRFDFKTPKWVNNYGGYLSIPNRSKAVELFISKNDCGVISCHQAIKREVFFKSGGFNPDIAGTIYVGDGETGLNIKIKKMGYKFAYTSKAIIYHVIPKSRTTLKYLLKRSENYGVSDSYTEYREHRDKDKIIKLMVKRNLTHLIKALGLTFFRVISGRLPWYFILVKLFYFHKRNIYDLKLYRNRRFRNVAEIDDWLKNEQETEF